MERKLITPIALGLLFTGFGIISFLVIISKRHHWFVEKKLKIGAMILSLSGAVIGCNVTTCYVAPESNDFILDYNLMSGDTTILKNNGTDTITGKIFSRYSEFYSYAILDSSEQIIIKDNILPVDGKFDEDTEEFSIKLNTTFAPGKYSLNFYENSADKIEEGRIDIPIILQSNNDAKKVFN